MSETARAMAIALTLSVSGCYLAHERDPVDAAIGRGAPDRLDAAFAPDAARAPDIGHDTNDPCAPLGNLVEVPGGASHAIEATEVTREAYGRFLACAAGPACAHTGCLDRDDDPQIPIRCTSPCEAVAYCAWAGRHLCTIDEWMLVCQSNQARVSEGSVVRDENQCVLSGWATAIPARDAGTSGAQPVRSAPNCCGATAPLDEVFDIIGNVSELVWVDPTAVGPMPMGHDYTSGPHDPCIIEGTPWTMDETAPNVGFRCCAD